MKNFLILLLTIFLFTACADNTGKIYHVYVTYYNGDKDTMVYYGEGYHNFCLDWDHPGNLIHDRGNWKEKELFSSGVRSVYVMVDTTHRQTAKAIFTNLK